jgi:hypothetical protein
LNHGVRRPPGPAHPEQGFLSRSRQDAIACVAWVMNFSAFCRIDPRSKITSS